MATQDKYDRQLRMWGIDGQKRLNNSKVLCLGFTGAGAETLKNLVLPGIGYIRIVGNKTTTERDLGANFFLTEASIGKVSVAEGLFHLMELNPDVKGESVFEDPMKYFRENKEKIKGEISLIISDGLTFVI